jgi:hypothetical protein
MDDGPKRLIGKLRKLQTHYIKKPKSQHGGRSVVIATLRKMASSADNRLRKVGRQGLREHEKYAD